MNQPLSKLKLHMRIISSNLVLQSDVDREPTKKNLNTFDNFFNG